MTTSSLSITRGYSYEVFDIESETKDDDYRFLAFLGRRCQQFYNACGDYWRMYHRKNNSSQKIETFLDAIAPLTAQKKKLLAQAKEQKGKALKQTQQDIKDIDDSIKALRPDVPMRLDLGAQGFNLYNQCAAEFSDLHSGIRSALEKRFYAQVAGLRSTMGLHTGWWAAILGYQRTPFANHPPGIPVKAKDVKLIREQTPGKPDIWKIRCSLGDGRRFTFRLRTIGKKEDKPRTQKKLAQYRRHLELVYDGILKLKDTEREKKAQIPKNLDSEQKNKERREIAKAITRLKHEFTHHGDCTIIRGKKRWKICLSVTAPVPDLAVGWSTKTAVLTPTTDPKQPLLLWLPGGETWYIGGTTLTRYVAYQRERLTKAKKARKDGYRHGTSNRRSHGRKRAWDGPAKFADAWNRVTEWTNRRAAREIIDLCVQQGIGNIIMIRPDESYAKNCALALAGKRPDDEHMKMSSWPWERLLMAVKSAGENFRRNNGFVVKVIDGHSSYTKPKPKAKKKKDRIKDEAA